MILTGLFCICFLSSVDICLLYWGMLYIWASGFVCYNQDFVIPRTSLHGCLLERGSTVVRSWEKMVGLLSTLYTY